MTEEENEAIRYLKQIQQDFLDSAKQRRENGEDTGYGTLEDVDKLSAFEIGIVLNLIQKQQEEIEYYKKQKRYDDQFKHELLEQTRCKDLKIDSLNKVLGDRLICIQGGRGLYAKLKGLDKEYLIREYLSMYKMCKQEIEKKDKIIDEMAKAMINYDCFIKECKHYAGENGKLCEDCIKEYFTLLIYTKKEV